MNNHWLFRKAKMPVLTKAISKNISILNKAFFINYCVIYLDYVY